jgi:hypothetical protein
VRELLSAGFVARATGAGIGCRGIGANGATNAASAFFKGTIDEAVVYSRALTAVEIQNYVNATK